ncbi:MAG: MFS transporter [Pseudomonadota bacterium]
MADISLKKRIWGWYFFDWASQPYHTVLNTFIFGPFFAAIAATYFLNLGLEETVADARAQTVWAWAVATYGIIIALSAPILGAMADNSGHKTPWIAAFSLMYVIGASTLWYTDPEASNLYWMLAAFGFGFIGGEFALIFTNAQLPGLGTEKEVGKISGSGFAFGYVGGLLALTIALAFFVEQAGGRTIVGFPPAFGLDPDLREGTRVVGPFVAIWFAVFMVPYFLWVREVRVPAKRIGVGGSLRSVWSSIKSLVHKKSLAAFLGGSMFYRDGLNGLYTFGGTYAALVLNWPVTLIGVFGVISAIGAAIFSYIGGLADRRFGPKPVVNAAIVILIFVSATIISISPTSVLGMAVPEGSGLPNIVFFACGVLIGGMGGVLQSASRSLMVRHCDPVAPTEYFGLYGMSGRATAFLAPLLIGVATTLSDNARIGVTPVIALFLIGLILMVWVNPKGERDA